MYYKLNKNYMYRGWKKLPYAIVEKKGNFYGEPIFFSKEQFMLLLSCNGVEDIQTDTLTEIEQKGLKELVQREIVMESATNMGALEEDQWYKVYPVTYYKSVLWSVTGKCNYKCRHCLVSAPSGCHPQITLEEALDIVDQLGKAGIYSIDLSGGEPLVRNDFMRIVEALTQNHIRIGNIFSNGSLINEKLLDGLERYHQRPFFQISYDGVGHHSWLRGVEGAEDDVMKAIKLLCERKFPYTCAMCIHRENASSLAETVRVLKKYHCQQLGLNTPQELGAWKEYADAYALGYAEAWEVYKDYIDTYFKEGMPISIMLDGFFACEKGSTKYRIPYHRNYRTMENLAECRYCESIRYRGYIDAEGRLSPCMGFADIPKICEHLPSVLEDGFEQATHDKFYRSIIETTVSQMVAQNPECQECEHVLHCGGGCMVQGTTQEGDYLIPDLGACYFHKNIGADEVRKVADVAIQKYVNKIKEDKL